MKQDGDEMNRRGFFKVVAAVAVATFVKPPVPASRITVVTTKYRLPIVDLIGGYRSSLSAEAALRAHKAHFGHLEEWLRQG